MYFLFFSCEDAAQQVLMSVCVSVCPWSIGHSANPKVPEGYQGLPKGCPRLPKLPKVTQALHAVPRAEMQFHDLAYSPMTLHTVP